jgi:endonuclease-3
VDTKARAREILRLLADAYPDARTELRHAGPWQLLVATVLSAQCTDERVNEVTPKLFARWPDPRTLARATQGELEAVIRPTGFFRQKARSLREAARVIDTEHDGQVPRDVEALVRLPGVGRKTAKVVLGEAYGIAAGVTVDTHVRRVTGRLGLSRATDPEEIAADLEGLVPKSDWIGFSIRMILHGRRVCRARRPDCEGCVVEVLCPKIGL